MKTIYFKCYKLALSLPLDKIAAYFKIHRTLSWKEFILLEGYHLEVILKYDPALKQVYLYEFGCITFVDFSESEVDTFLKYLESIMGALDYTSFARYRETHVINLLDKGKCSLWKRSTRRFKYSAQVIPLTASVLAKSTALYRLETELALLLDEAEKYIEFLRRGRLRASTRDSAVITSRFLRFQLNSLSSIRIFDRSASIEDSLQTREIYDALAEYYELFDRYEIVESKITDLRTIIRNYSELSYKQNENRLYVFEAFLLALFPLSSLLHYLLG